MEQQAARWSDSLRQSGKKLDSSHDATNNNNKEKCNRNLQLQEDVQAVISENGKQKIEALLEQICGLLPIEQLLLYLKLPTEQTASVDPLRKSTNPLGSRSEINQTIIWIQTHLEEDKELSLQKKGVYDHYVAHCEPNGIKPLSTADFGKVMKQVYPSVRPRRLGTRGQSKYCYSGLRSRMKLDIPSLPDLSEKAMSTESSCNQSEYMAAVWCIIKEWAEMKLSMQFKSAISLAYYLVKELSIAIGSEAAQLVQTLAASSLNVDSHYGYLNRHKDTALQLQRKLQQIKDSHKRRGIDKSEQKLRYKKFKKSPPSTSCSTSPNSPPPHVEYTTATNCDMGNSVLPDSAANSEQFVETNQTVVHRCKGKGYRPRSSKQSPGKRRNKYKSIQPKQEYCDEGDEVGFDMSSKTLRQRVKKEELAFFPNELSDPYFSRERLESVSQVSKDALDEYLGGSSNNGQEPEEEIIKYLGNEEESSKLTQLRELLVQNCPSSTTTSTVAKTSRKTKRRVSFERNVRDEHSNNFKPIASPTGKLSMCSSTNVSPRNTPVMRSRNNVHSGPPPPPPPPPHLKRPHLELKLQEAAAFRNQMAMSAPPSPKTYGYSSRLYTHMQPYNQGVDSPMVEGKSFAFRSQSVPVPENEMLQNTFNFAPQELVANEMMNEMDAMQMYPSRSVPSTPLPYSHPLDFNAYEKSSSMNAASKSYPTTPLAADTFSYGQTHDYLLNGQPIKDKQHELNFMQAEDAHAVATSLEQNIPDCELINKPNIDDLFQNCA